MATSSLRGSRIRWDLFHSGIRTQTTDATYTTILRIVLCAICEDVLSGTFEERARELVGRARKDPTWARDLMHGISSLLRRRTELPRTDGNYLAPSSIASYFAPLRKLLDMNDIGVPWSRIYGTFPPKERMAGTRGWHREEIQKMLRHAPGTKHRAVILTIASSGVRVGGLELDWGDLTPIVRRDGRIVESGDAQEGERVECAALRVYRGSREEYVTFVTPEAYEALMEYRLEWQQDVGRPPGPTDPMFKKNGPAPDRLGAPSIDAQVNKLLHRTGLRQPAPGERRYKVPALHGFRRFWNKTMKDAISDDSPVSSLTKKEYMMGHAGMTALDRNYYHTHTLGACQGVHQRRAGPDDRRRGAAARGEPRAEAGDAEGGARGRRQDGRAGGDRRLALPPGGRLRQDRTRRKASGLPRVQQGLRRARRPRAGGVRPESGSRRPRRVTHRGRLPGLGRPAPARAPCGMP